MALTRRVVHLLEPELTPRQRAQKKYQASAKGKAAAKRALKKLRERERADPVLMARKVASIASLGQGHKLHTLVRYLRVPPGVNARRGSE